MLRGKYGEIHNRSGESVDIATITCERHIYGLLARVERKRELKKEGCVCDKQRVGHSKHLEEDVLFEPQLNTLAYEYLEDN